MDVIGKKPPKRTKKSAAGFKVVYISSPMKVKTSASKFRSLVQKLTGQDSDAESFMELIAGDRNFQSSAFLDYQILGDDNLIDRDHRLVAGKIETAAYQSLVAPPEDDFVLQNFDASFEEMLHGFFA
ncbi:sigma factor binding protein 1, chloroplastic-like [Cucurbita pepo subsp. pepo]|uniref:sigma factor binding protein 1, chloroplastic-like n=1 Tax=Cucurbita pepo subsp. pepo TaxID=3664 RepID=UPI000C9D3576|nr:sigma factor binding protein 1, chloroplastic-like [Cucurbita pepo subsp. pepo]